MEDGRKAVHALFEQGFQRLGCHVAACKAGAAGGDDHIHAPVERPVAHGVENSSLVVCHDGAGGDLVSGFLYACD
ncbi:hypothetical protein D3C87_1971950 [compost metagenome]